MKVRDLSAALGGSCRGDVERDIHSVSSLENAGPDDLSFLSLSTAKFLAKAQASRAGCLLVPESYAGAGTLIQVRDPRAAVARAIQLLYPSAKHRSGVHSTAVIASTASIAGSAWIGSHAVIEEGAQIGEASVVGPGCVVGERSRLGDNCLLHAGVTIYHDVRIGSHVILHSGCVIGADGFGFVLAGDHYEKFPQVGRVEIGDRVEIGANSCVDRAALGVTSIGEGTKLDNMVHVGHNCKIGKHVVVAAQTGFSGGVEIGDYAVIGGQVGVGDKARIESRAVVGSGSGILTSKIVRAGQPVWGTPARPLREHLESLAVLGKLRKSKKN
jgi:UDP-3-O-[3-hydroxymyristoyl] glucosamine N-acyltransferase